MDNEPLENFKIYKGDQATCPYENGIFDDLANQLNTFFKDKNVTAVLYGHPKIPSDPTCKPDALLITDSAIIVIDFKNYGGKITLPSAGSEWHNNNTWRSNENLGCVINEGRTNPFKQLENIRDKLKRVFRNIPGVNFEVRNPISAGVIFHGNNPVIAGNIPGQFERRFFVATKENCLQTISHFVFLRGNNDISLSSQSFAAIHKLISSVTPFDNFYAVDSAKVKTLTSENAQLRAEAKLAEEEIIKAKSKTKLAEQKAKNAKKEAETAVIEDRRELTRATNALAEEKKLEREERERKDREAKHKEEEARREAKRKAAEASQKAKIRLISIAVAGVIGAIAAIAVNIINVNERKAAEEAAAAQLEEDYRNGRVCIPVERVADFYGEKNVCIDFYASYINDSKYYVFIDDEKNGTFALMASKNLISETEAKARYLNKHLEVRGAIIKYEDTFEIKIEDLSQIKNLED